MESVLSKVNASGIPGSRFCGVCMAGSGHPSGPGRVPGSGMKAGAAADSGIGRSTSSKQSGVTKTSSGKGGGAASVSSAAVESSDLSVSDTNFPESPQSPSNPGGGSVWAFSSFSGFGAGKSKKVFFS